MDTSDPLIRFDASGQCNHCNGYLKRAPKILYHGAPSDQTLQELIARVKTRGQGRDHDCLIGVSGGTDSSYLAYLAHSWGLRPLLVHLDNGWNSDKAVMNIQRVSSALGLDYQSFVLNWDEFRQIQLAYLRSSIVEMEMPTDVAIQGALHQVAAEQGIHYILSGGNLATEGILPRSWFYYPKDSRLLHGICKKFGVKVSRNFPTFDVPSELYYKYIKNVRNLYPLNYVDYDRATAQAALKRECEWVDYGGKHHESRFTKFVQGYLQPHKFGVDYRRCTLATQVCLNNVTRDEALAILEKSPFDAPAIEKEKIYVAKKLGISVQELELIIQQPPKSYRDYPNNELLLRFIYAVHRLLFAARDSYDTSDER